MVESLHSILHELCIKSHFFSINLLSSLLNHINFCCTTFIGSMTQFFGWFFSFLFTSNSPFYALFCDIHWTTEAWCLRTAPQGTKTGKVKGNVTALHYHNKKMFQHINNDIFRLQFLVFNCQSNSFKYTTQTHTVICNYTLMCSKGKRVKVQRL